MNKNRHEFFRMTVLINFNNELTGLNKKAVELAAHITKNFEEPEI